MGEDAKKITTKERRKAQRLNIPIQVKYKLLPRKRVLQQTFCQDISGKGARLILDSPLKKGDRLKTLLYFPEDSRPVTAFSKIIWCKRNAARKKKAGFETGMQYIRIDPKDRERFVFLFCEMMINYFLQGKLRLRA